MFDFIRLLPGSWMERKRERGRARRRGREGEGRGRGRENHETGVQAPPQGGASGRSNTLATFHYLRLLLKVAFPKTGYQNCG